MTLKLTGSLLCLLTLSLTACGGGGGTGNSPHQVPRWLMRQWRVTTVELGVPLDERGQNMTIDANHFEYHYPDCNVYGTLLMDPFIPSYASNQYVMTMDERTNCSVLVDIDAAPGVTDTGRIWSFDDGETFERLSDNAPGSFWVYEKL